MTAKMDADLIDIGNGIYDIHIGVDGDIVTTDSFDSAILMSLLCERRASESEMPEADRRRGWIGNVGTGFEIGSKLWLFEQSRLTLSVVDSINDATKDCLQWLVDDNYASKILKAEAVIESTKVGINITIQRPESKVENRYYSLWDNTGIPIQSPSVSLPEFTKYVNSETDLNIFTLMGNPAGVVDAHVYVTGTLGASTTSTYGIDTGTGWHASSTITLHLDNVSSTITGAGGAGGRGGGLPLITYPAGGGGGGGAGSVGGVGGSSQAAGGEGIIGNLSSGGRGKYGATYAATINQPGQVGSPGGIAINMQHNLSIDNTAGTIQGGGGGGGGINTDNTLLAGDGGGPAIAGFASADNAGGAAGAAIDKNGNTLTFIATGNILGAIV